MNMTPGLLNQKFAAWFLSGRSLPVGRHGSNCDVTLPNIQSLQFLKDPKFRGEFATEDASSLPFNSTIASQARHQSECAAAGSDIAVVASGLSFRNAARVQESLTARMEKKALLWIASRLPLWVTSDQLTCLGLGGMVLGWASYFLARWYRAGFLLAAFSLVVNWFGDSLDGTLARVRNQQRPRYGFYVDHVIDSIGAVLLMSGLALSGCLDWRIAAAMLVGFLLLSIESYLSTYTIGVFQMSFGKFGPTEIRILLALGNLALWWNPHATVFGRFRLFDFGGIIASALMLAMFLASAARHTYQLYREEPIATHHRETKSLAKRVARHVD
jgi:archaetidylinositol phosphate synthase